jgi:N-carbamoyl-L-amino-acid hydrolase
MKTEAKTGGPAGGALRVNGERLWESLMEMARIGATGRGGVCRLALTEEDRGAREQFRAWCAQEHCEISIDRIGNLFARRRGRDSAGPPVVLGSHLDSQPTGGKFDGAYGVLAGLEVVRRLNELDIATQAPLEVAVWTNEEGARFAPAMLGSGTFAGVFDLDEALGRADAEGTSVRAALDRIGYAGPAEVGGRPFGAHLELHIEQGPVLEQESATIGVVTGVQGIRWYDLELEGAEAHAGPTPMHLRRDPVPIAAKALKAVFEIATGRGPAARATVGQISSEPSSRNTVPRRVRASVDFRHPEATVLDAMETELRSLSWNLGGGGVRAELSRIWASDPVSFDPRCVAAVREAADRLGHRHLDLVSGAGHDSVYLSRVAPTAMIFVPCEGGISHNEAENARREDLAAGADVLLNAALDLAEVER